MVLAVDLFFSVEHRIEGVPLLIRRFVIALAKESDQELIVLVLWEIWDMLRSESLSTTNLIRRPSGEAACHDSQSVFAYSHAVSQWQEG
jgi:hypothetical protein